MTTRVMPGLKRRNSRGSKVAVIAALIAATFPGTGVPGQQTPSPPDERPAPSYVCDLGDPNPLRNTLAASANATHAFARGALEFLGKVSVMGTGAMKSSAKDLSCDSFHRNAGQTSLIRHVVIESATAETPRSDTASIAELSDGRLMVVYHRYERGKHGGHDHGVCRIWSKISRDGGMTWQTPRMLVDVAEDDMNVQAPALLRLKSGQLLMICLRAHQGGSSSTMCVLSSQDDGKSFVPLTPVWRKSKGQLLQGGASSLLQLTSGRLLLPFHGGSGNQWRQKNSAWCFFSDNLGETWQRSAAIELPRRGAMEASVAEAADGSLLMSLRTQLGGPHLSRSTNGGQTWSEPFFSGLRGGESCTCLRRIPGSKKLVLFWNNSVYDGEHHHFGERTPLTAATSSDRGKSWQIIGNLADDPEAEYTNLDCFFTSTGDAIVTYMMAKPAWNRNRIHLKAALIPRAWFRESESNTANGSSRANWRSSIQ